MKPSTCLLVFGLSIAYPGCAASTAEPVQDEILRFEVARDSVPCVGEARRMCIEVRYEGSDAWQKFYDSIEGFRHEPGTLYTLEVVRSPVSDPPADASAWAYRLVRILAQDPAGG